MLGQIPVSITSTPISLAYTAYLTSSIGRYQGVELADGDSDRMADQSWYYYLLFFLSIVLIVLVSVIFNHCYSMLFQDATWCWNIHLHHLPQESPQHRHIFHTCIFGYYYNYD